MQPQLRLANVLGHQSRVLATKLSLCLQPQLRVLIQHLPRLQGTTRTDTNNATSIG